MRYLLITLILLSFTGCQSAEEKAQAQATHDAKIIKQAREDLMAELKAKEEAQLKEDNLKNAKLSQVGITVHDKKITINPDKAKEFFNNIGKKVAEKLQKITKGLEKGMIDNQETGVHINENKINIDLNKTQDFLSVWGKKMQTFVKDIDNMAKAMDTKNNN